MKREEKGDSFFYRLERETLEKGLLPDRLRNLCASAEAGEIAG
jgi:hypothetical protein